MVKGEVYMDELEALRILRGEKSPETEMAEEISEKKKRGPLPAGVLLIFIILGFLLQFVVAFYANTHPLDRILLKMALMKNYTVTMTVGTKSVAMQVDGNVMYYNDRYYETVGEDIYEYYVYENGKWARRKLSSNAVTGGVDSSLIETILDKENYQMKLFNIGEFKLQDNLHPNDIHDISTTVAFGQLNCSGKIFIQQYFGMITETVYIRISDFGKNKLELPVLNTNAN